MVIKCPAYRVARGRRTQQRQYQVRAGRHAPHAQGLAEIRAASLQTGPSGDIKQTENAENRVDRDPQTGFGRVHGSGLQSIVHGRPDVLQITKKIAHAGLYRLRDIFLVTHCHRPEQLGIHLIIELTDAPVGGFVRVLRIGGRVSSASCQHGGSQQCHIAATDAF